MPRWTTPISVIPTSNTNSANSEEDSTDYPLVSGFGTLNPDEAGMMEGLCSFGLINSWLKSFIVNIRVNSMI